MVRHVVMFRWAEGTTSAQLAAITAGLTNLPAAIAEIREYRFGPDLGLVSGNFDFVVVADFEDQAAYEVYRDHPVHRALIDTHIAPAIAERAAVQYVT